MKTMTLVVAAVVWLRLHPSGSIVKMKLGLELTIFVAVMDCSGAVAHSRGCLAV